jgi:hypothetical protein
MDPVQAAEIEIRLQKLTDGIPYQEDFLLFA